MLPVCLGEHPAPQNRKITLTSNKSLFAQGKQAAGFGCDLTPELGHGINPMFLRTVQLKDTGVWTRRQTVQSELSALSPPVLMPLIRVIFFISCWLWQSHLYSNFHLISFQPCFLVNPTVNKPHSLISGTFCIISWHSSCSEISYYLLHPLLLSYCFFMHHFREEEREWGLLGVSWSPNMNICHYCHLITHLPGVSKTHNPFYEELFRYQRHEKVVKEKNEDNEIHIFLLVSQVEMSNSSSHLSSGI